MQHTRIDIPLRHNAIDTSQVIPTVYLKRATHVGFEDTLFISWRKGPSFALSKKEYHRGSTLVVGFNSGAGSPYEHTVQALKDCDFRIVPAPKFADIFRDNAGKQGLAAEMAVQEDVEQLWKVLETNLDAEITVGLESRAVRAEGFAYRFGLDDYMR